MRKIRKGDKVFILSGRDKGKVSEIMKINVKKKIAIIKNINIVKRHQSQSKNKEAGIIRKESPINLSNIAIIDPTDGKPTRVGFKFEENGKKIRFSKRSGAKIDA